jgi:hypothetical protein
MARSGPSSSVRDRSLAEQCYRVRRAQRLDAHAHGIDRQAVQLCPAHPGSYMADRGQALSLLDRGGADQQPRLRSRTWSERARPTPEGDPTPDKDVAMLFGIGLALADCPAADLDLNPHVGRQPVPE